MFSRKACLLSICTSLLLIVNGCSQINTGQQPVGKPAVDVSNKAQAWKQRQQYLSAKPSWNLNSKISLRFDDENWIFGLNWAQRSLKQYVMQIKNPITGALVAKLDRNNKGVTLLANDGKTYRDTDEERLLQSQSGLKLPVKGMQYWVRGLTSPQYKVDQLNLDAMGRPQSIYQVGWKINYSSYSGNNFNSMPTKMTLVRDEIYLKVIAKRWQGI